MIANKLSEFAKLDHDTAVNDLTVKKPKIVMVQTDGDVPIQNEPPHCLQLLWPSEQELSAALQHYDFIKHVKGYALYLRKD